MSLLASIIHERGTSETAQPAFTDNNTPASIRRKKNTPHSVQGIFLWYDHVLRG